MEEHGFLYLYSRIGREPTLEECRAIGMHSIAVCCSGIVAKKKTSKRLVTIALACYYACCRILGQKVKPADKPTLANCPPIFNASRCINILISSQPSVLYNSYVSSLSAMSGIDIDGLNDMLMHANNRNIDTTVTHVMESKVAEAKAGKKDIAEETKRNDGKGDEWSW